MKAFRLFVILSAIPGNLEKSWGMGYDKCKEYRGSDSSGLKAGKDAETESNREENRCTINR